MSLRDMKREANVAGDEADEAFDRMADEQRKFPPDPMRLAYLKYRLDRALGRLGVKPAHTMTPTALTTKDRMTTKTLDLSYHPYGTDLDKHQTYEVDTMSDGDVSVTRVMPGYEPDVHLYLDRVSATKLAAALLDAVDASRKGA